MTDAAASDPMIGRDLDGRYTILEKLGEGGMGAVYRGTQHSVGREVAVKVVAPKLVTDPVVIKRFLREAKLSSRLAHPNAVAVLDFAQTVDGVFYLVMELVNGRTLDQVIEAEGALAPARVVRIGAQICDALEGAHQLQIIHRDLKPSNVMIMTTGRDLVKVLDFGLAKSLTPEGGATTMTHVGAIVGSPAFLPPEVVTGGEADGRADLYSLGCVLYHAAQGHLPFQLDSTPALIAAHAFEAPPPLTNVPPGLARVIDRLLAKEPADRFQTAAATREALEAALVGDAPPPPVRKPSTGPSTVIGWSGTPTPPRPATPPGGVARVGTPVGSSQLAPAERRQLESSPTLVSAEHVVPPVPATPSRGVRAPVAAPGRAPAVPGAPARSSNLKVLIALAAAMLVGGVIAFVAIDKLTASAPRATPPAPSPAPTASPAPTTPAPTTSTPTASSAPAPAASAAVASSAPAPAASAPAPAASAPAPTETKPTKRAATKPAKPAVTATKPAKPAATKPTKPAPHPPLPTQPGPVRVNPGAF